MSFWVIILVSFVLLFMLLGFVTLNRFISYKERVALAQLGFSLEDLHRDAAKKYGNRGVLWGGVITAMSGLALLLGLSTLGTGAWLLAGLLPMFVGLGMVVIYLLTLGPVPHSKNDHSQLEDNLTEQLDPEVRSALEKINLSADSELPPRSDPDSAES
ncbi:MAG: hypothetical protein FJZ90_06600 [Chloroflexi bacterium]|nr:hypothetical protein [Chloroflexota bacterium]